MSNRKVFRSLASIEAAEAKLREHFTPKPVGVEEAALQEAYGRILAEDVFASIDVPGFDRASMDGYAVRAQDTFGAEEDRPVRLTVVGKVEAGEKPSFEVGPFEAAEIGTGAPMPKGANAVVMVEYTEQRGAQVDAFRAVSPGENVTAAGSDIMLGELVLRRGQRLTPRELGVLAALGLRTVKLYRKPKVAVISTGNELTPLGRPLEYGRIYDINAVSLAGSVVESGGTPLLLGVAGDRREEIEAKIREGLQSADVVVTSGSTSAGVGDLLYRVIDSFGEPGILVHGISVKPGKPTIIAVVNGKPLFGLPGYPASAMVIFNLLVKPVISAMAGVFEARRATSVEAQAAVRIYAARGRREYLPVYLVEDETGRLKAYPLLSGSGAITSLAMADGFAEVPENREFLDEGETLRVTLFSPELQPTELMIIGSHCVGVDALLGLLFEAKPGLTAKVVNVGSVGGFQAVSRGDADLAGVHLLDEATGEYNRPFLAKYGLAERAVLIRGYSRVQGLMVAPGNPKRVTGLRDLLRTDVSFINRNAGSGTRLLTDLCLRRVAEENGLTLRALTERIKGYSVEAKSHSAAAAAVLYGKADVTVGIRAAAVNYGLDFIPLADERYDFLALKTRLEKPAVKAFLEALRSPEFKVHLEKRTPGLNTTEETGKIL
ncbi:MAG: molybdopterin biosynthesis protein [Candidatus Bathyarchaeia archaeon]